MIDLLAFLQQLVVRLEIEDPEAETLISQLELVPPSESVNFKTDLKNAGARWVDKEVVCDQGLTTSRTPADLDAFIAKMVEEIQEGIHARQKTA